MKWNPRYVAYARLTGYASPEERRERDRVIWPGGIMAGYTLWMSSMYRLFRVNTGQLPEWDGNWSNQQLRMFDEFLNGWIAETESREPWYPTFGGYGDGI